MRSRNVTGLVARIASRSTIARASAARVAAARERSNGSCRPDARRSFARFASVRRTTPIVLFREEFLDGLRDGRVTLAFRRWRRPSVKAGRSEEHTSELQSQSNLVCRL